MEFCFLSSFFQRADRVRKSKWFQQMGLGLTWPSVSEVQENEKSGWGCATQSLNSCEDLSLKHTGIIREVAYSQSRIAL